MQLAKAPSAKVIAITSSSKVFQLKQLGADEVVLRDADLVETLGSNSIDIEIDLVAGFKRTPLVGTLKQSKSSF